jgi:hypothetical protein
MPSKDTDPDSTLLIQNVRNLVNRHNHQKCGLLWNTQRLPPKRRISVPADVMYSSQGGSSVPSTIQGQNSTPSSWLIDSLVADNTQGVTCTPSTTQRWSLCTPTATPGTSSRNTPSPSGTIQTNSTRHVESSPASGLASTPTPLRGL